MRLSRTFRTVAAAAALATGLAACASDDTADSGDDAATGALAEYDLSGLSFTVGSKDFDEQLILGYIALAALEEAGADVEDQIGLAGTAAARDALETNEISMYWEYDGTGWGTHLGNSLAPENLPDPLPEAVREADLEENGIVWLEPAGFNNTYALAIREEAELASEIDTISDIVALLEEDPEAASLCIESEFSTRDDGLPGMEAFYGFEWPDDQVDVIDTGLIYTQTDSGDCTFGEVFASDGRIANLGLKVIEYDMNFFPPYNPSATFNQESYEQAPEVLSDLFADVAAPLDLETMTALNAAVSADGEDPEDVARDFLRDNGLIG